MAQQSEASKTGPTPEEKRKIYEENTIKQIVLYFENAEYLSILERLKIILKETGLETHSDVFLHLLKEYENNRNNKTASGSEDFDEARSVTE